MTTVYLNGEFLPIEAARVPVMDRGFLFGDGVYEVIPVYSRQAFRLREHLQRLHAGLAAIRLSSPHNDTEWTALVAQMIALSPFDDQSIYLQITRGVDAARSHAFPQHTRPTVFLMSEELAAPSRRQREHGVAAISAVDQRWLHCDIKSTSLVANVLLRQLAVDAGCVETVLFRDGILTEGAASNMFVVKNEVMLAPRKNNLMLPGITYDVILELAASHGMPHEVRDISETEVRQADELWMTSSTKEVLPIVNLDGRSIGDGKPGACYAAMYGWYQHFKQTVMRGS
jgi:D-alanine transaminase